MNYQLISEIENDTNLTTLEKIFIRRGIPAENIDHYLNTTQADILDPLQLKNMQEGAKLLVSHIKNQDKILVQVDSDCDGFTSSALLINYLNALFPYYTQNHVRWRIHKGKEHGIIPDTITDDVKLVIAPDSSSNDYEEHKILRDRGVDVLVIDHHEASQESENACIINNQLCDYPNKSLSGVGVVYKFCSYIDTLLGTDYAENYLDLAAVGIIGDMMDLRNYETHELIQRGLLNIKNAFLKAMIDKQNYSISRHGELDPFSISFYIVPQINATIRAGELDEKYILFESMLDFMAYNMVDSTKKRRTCGRARSISRASS